MWRWFSFLKQSFDDVENGDYDSDVGHDGDDTEDVERKLIYPDRQLREDETSEVLATKKNEEEGDQEEEEDEEEGEEEKCKSSMAYEEQRAFNILRNEKQLKYLGLSITPPAKERRKVFSSFSYVWKNNYHVLLFSNREIKGFMKVCELVFPL